MNRYRVEMTVFHATACETTVDAGDEASARADAEAYALDIHPDADEVRVDDVVDLGPVEPAEPEPDALTQARDLIEQLLEEADEAVEYLREQAGATKAIGEDDVAEGFRQRADDLERTIANANAFLCWEPPAPAKVDPAPIDEDQEDEDEDTSDLDLDYVCPACQHEWSDTWSCAVDDDCPACGLRHISPSAIDGEPT